MKRKSNWFWNLMCICLTLSGCLFCLAIVNVQGYNRPRLIVVAIILLVPALIFYRQGNVLKEQEKGIFVYRRKTAMVIFSKIDQFVKNFSVIDFAADINSDDDGSYKMKIIEKQLNKSDIRYDLSGNCKLTIGKEFSQRIGSGDVFDFSEEGKITIILKDYGRPYYGVLVLKGSE